MSDNTQFPLRRTPAWALALTIASLTGLSACGGGGSDSASTDSATGTFSLAVTDAPIDSAAKVVVEFTGVAIKPTEGDAIEIAFSEPKSINLLDLQGTASASLLEGETVTAGEYEWVRLDVNAEFDGVTDSYIEMNDGTQLELRIPSGSQSGLKLVSGFTVPAGGSADFTIDFDLRKSVTLPGGQAGPLLKPALRMVDNTAVGSVSGTVDATLISTTCSDASLDDGAVYVYSGADVTPTDVQGSDTDPLVSALVNFVEGEYRYEVGFLSEGTYSVAYTCDTELDDPVTADALIFTDAANVTVTANAVTTHNIP